MATDSQALIGMTVAGCRVEAQLGRGGMGSVFVGRQNFLERPVAIKVLSQQFASELDFIDRFEEEGRTLASLRHPNIAQIYNMAVDHGRHVLIMEFVEGVSLGERLRSNEPLSLIEFAYVFLQISRALEAAADKGVVHRDIKPDNIMITPGGVAKLVDFGIAATATKTNTDKVSGSVQYMSPEQARGGAFDHRSDLYSLGITMWHALMGRVPFDAEKPSRVALQHITTPIPSLNSARVARKLSDLVKQLTQKDPGDRPRHARVVSDVLMNFLRTSPKAPWALVAEPDTTRARVLAEICTTYGLTPVVCQSGDDALAVLELRVSAPQLTITELTLPGLDGVMLLRHLSRHAEQGTTPKAIVLSEFSDLLDSVSAEAFRLKVECIAGRPGSTAWLRSSVAHLLGRSAPLGQVDVDQSIVPASERARARHQRLDQMRVVDQDAQDEPLRGWLAQLAGTLEVPVALVSLVLEDRQWFKAHVGLEGDLLDARGTPIEQAFCRHVVDAGTPMVINDATQHTYFRDNALVKAGGVGAYAGAPVITPTGIAIGTVCIIDNAPRATEAAEVDSLVIQARRVAGRLQLLAPKDIQNQDLAQLTGLEPALSTRDLHLDWVPWPDRAVLLFDDSGHVAEASLGCELIFECDASALVGMPRSVCVARLQQVYDAPGMPDALRVSAGYPYATSGRISTNVEGLLLHWAAWPRQFSEGVFQLESFWHGRTSAAPSTASLTALPEWKDPAKLH